MATEGGGGAVAQSTTQLEQELEMLKRTLIPTSTAIDDLVAYCKAHDEPFHPDAAMQRGVLNPWTARDHSSCCDIQ
eukprot:CAMPEP_0185158576 /NCGR_PEP_ID=MMETSP1139-20130426/2498_1 /TAXON_ID=298111 /ORGANISM="Pavlova sp., Strain CCMP459" /LENGTH=75 /DNA_ID=CAMNT_0027723719 /DNA_START=46 /DNA_END=273 /DNA_ORIENTATION=+